ncbi:glycosyltransferase family 4 protein [Dysgonomonas reticulitermitis]
MRILYLSYFFEPDLSAGSFRNTSLAKELAVQIGDNSTIDLITTLPNRYSTYKIEAPLFEKKENINIYRIQIPSHKNGFLDQINSFRAYFCEVKKIAKKQKYDLVYASSSKLFTAYLGQIIARKQKCPLYLDIRDIFVESLDNALENSLLRKFITPCLKFVERKTFNYASHINLISEGFAPYFKKFKCQSYSTYTNGIDDVFLKEFRNYTSKNNQYKTILYAGNIGKCQALHKIIPPVAKLVGENYKFIIVGDGGIKQLLFDEIKKNNLTNVEIKVPVKRDELIKLYQESDFLFIHLENHPAFEKVIPSKVFELGATNKPIIAGVSGFFHNFITKYLSNTIMFEPCDYKTMAVLLQKYKYQTEYREEFIKKFTRENINKEMVKSIIQIAQI